MEKEGRSSLTALNIEQPWLGPYIPKRRRKRTCIEDCIGRLLKVIGEALILCILTALLSTSQLFLVFWCALEDRGVNRDK
jgi:hypothetical protein